MQRPVEIERILVSTQHADGLDSRDVIKPDLIEKVLHPILPRDFTTSIGSASATSCHVNPTGKFVARRADGRYGPDRPEDHRRHLRRHGSPRRRGLLGQGPDEVDRSAAYTARYVAKNLVAAGLADRCEVNIAYAIGVARPVSIDHQTFGTETSPIGQIEDLVAEHFDLRPAAILRDLDLRRPIYAKTAALRPLRPRRPRLHLGADGQGRRTARGRGPRRVVRRACRAGGARRRRRTRRLVAVARELRRPDEEARRGLLADGALGAVDDDRHLTRRGAGVAYLDLPARLESLLVEPVEEVAVVLGQPDDGRARARREVGERREVAILRLLELRVDRPPVRAALRVAESPRDPVDHVVGEGVADSSAWTCASAAE